MILPYSTSDEVLHMEGRWHLGGGGVVGRLVCTNLVFGDGVLLIIINTLDLESNLG